MRRDANGRNRLSHSCHPEFYLDNTSFSSRMKTTMKIESILGPAYNEFDYNEYPAITSRFLCMNIIDCNVRKLGYDEHPVITSRFLCMNIIDCNVRKSSCSEHPFITSIFLLVVSGTQCTYIY